MQLKVNEEYKSIISPLSEEEYKLLEQSILEEGCRDAICILADLTIIDGHNRYEICQKNNITFDTKVVDITADEVEEWMYLNQLGRRNLDDKHRAYYIGKFYEVNKRKWGTNQHERGDEDASSPLDPEEIESKTKVTVRTAQVDADFAKAIDVIAAEDPKLKQDILNNGKISKKDVVKLSKIDKDDASNIINDVLNGKEKNVKASIKNKERKDRSELAKSVNVSYDTIYNGDAIEKLKLLDDNSIDCVITDPPYGIDYKDRRATHNVGYEDETDYAIELFAGIAKELNRVCKADCHLYVFVADHKAHYFRLELEKYFNVAPNHIIWVKNNHTICSFEKTYAPKHEAILFASRGNKILNSKCSPDVLQYDRPTDKMHSAQKPIDLIRYLIENSTVEGEIVLDPCAGSGTTPVACKMTKRNYIAIELEKEHYETMISRLNSVLV